MVSNSALVLHFIKHRHRNRMQGARRRRVAFARKQAKERAFFFVLLAMSCQFRFPSVRTVWMRERSGHWWEHVVQNFSLQDWLKNFRMSRATFVYLCGELKPRIDRTDTVMRKAIEVEKRVGMVLWFLATGTDYRTIGHLFGVSKSTVCLLVKEVCAAIVELLQMQYIRIPVGSALKAVISGFKNDYGFPQCAGAVDGTHIPI